VGSASLQRVIWSAAAEKLFVDSFLDGLSASADRGTVPGPPNSSANRVFAKTTTLQPIECNPTVLPEALETLINRE